MPKISLYSSTILARTAVRSLPMPKGAAPLICCVASASLAAIIPASSPDADETLIGYVVLGALAFDYLLELGPSLFNNVSRSLFWLFTGLFAPMFVAAFAFATATTRGGLMDCSAVFMYTGASILVYLIPATSAPNGPPQPMQIFVNLFFASCTAIAWHAVVFKWEETETLGRNSRILRRGLVLGLAFIISASAIAQWALRRNMWWSVCRLAGVLCGALRLLAIILLFCDGATTYPPGALPFADAVLVVCVMPAAATLFTPTMRLRFAHVAGISLRIQRLQAKLFVHNTQGSTTI